MGIKVTIEFEDVRHANALCIATENGKLHEIINDIIEDMDIEQLEEPYVQFDELSNDFSCDHNIIFNQ